MLLTGVTSAACKMQFKLLMASQCCSSVGTSTAHRLVVIVNLNTQWLHSVAYLRYQWHSLTCTMMPPQLPVYPDKSLFFPTNTNAPPEVATSATIGPSHLLNSSGDRPLPTNLCHKHPTGGIEDAYLEDTTNPHGTLTVTNHSPCLPHIYAVNNSNDFPFLTLQPPPPHLPLPLLLLPIFLGYSQGSAAWRFPLGEGKGEGIVHWEGTGRRELVMTWL